MCGLYSNFPGTGSSFRTDAEISGATGPREKELQKWQAGPETAVDLSWDVSALGNWDQFETNRQKFGVETDYSDDLYTTSIDRTAPRYREWDAQATRIAKEIAHSEAANSHVAEERKMDTHADGGLGEEEKYALCARDQGPVLTIFQVQRCRTRHYTSHPWPDQRLCTTIKAPHHQPTYRCRCTI